MARQPYRSIPKAAEFDISALSNPGGKSGFLCLSESTWELAYNLVLFYGGWRSRYYYTDPTTKEQLTITDEEYTEVSRLYQLALEELQMSGCEDLVNAVLALSDNLSEYAMEQATDGDSQPHDGSVSWGQTGDQFQTELEYNTAKCNVSNAIWDRIKDAVDWLENNDADIAAGLFGAGTTALIGWMIASGPIGWAIVGVSSAVVGILTTVLTDVSLNLEDVQDALDEQHDDLVCALYGSSNAISAKENFLDVLADAPTTLSTIELGLVGLMLTFKLNNQLFEPDADVINYVSADPSPCNCGLTAMYVEIESGGPGGEIQGDNTFNAEDDTVIVNSSPDPSYSGCYLIYVTIRTGTVQTDVNLSIAVDDWSSFAALPCNVENSFAYGDDFDPLVQSWSSSTEPDAASLSNVAIIALRSGSAFSATFTRLAD